MSNLGQTLLIPAKGSSGLPVPSNNLVVGVGGSTVAAAAVASGGSVPGVATYGKFQAQTCNASGLGSFLTWACILPKTGDSAGDGKMRWCGAHATGGITMQQVYDDHVIGSDSPQYDAVKPGMAVVHVGPNDAASFTDQAAIDTKIAIVRQIYTALISQGILPVSMSCSPHNTYPDNVKNFNTSLSALASSMGLTYIDGHTPCANPDGTWKTNYNTAGTDPVHPSVIGAKAMGQVLRDGIDSLLPNVTPTLATTATDDSAAWLYKNGSFTDDGNGDFVPDGGMTQSATYWTQVANGCAWELGTRSGYDGKACRWNKTTDPGDTTWTSTGAGAPIIVIPNSHLIAFGFKAEVISASASTSMTFTGRHQTTSATNPFRLNIQNDTIHDGSVAPFVWYQEWTAPADFADDANTGKMRFINTITGTGTSTADMYLGQWTVRDRTVG